VLDFPVSLVRFLINLWPPLLFTGISLVKLSQDWRFVRVEMPLRFYNKNVLGIHFGGSLYSMIDPWYMMMLAKNLGSDYHVVDHSASIQYQNPGLDLVYAEFLLDNQQIDEIKRQAEGGEKVIKTFTVEIKSIHNDIICTATKNIYIRKK